jgi:glutathione peroxidase
MNGIKYVRPGGGYVPHPDLHHYWFVDVNGVNTHPMYTVQQGSCPQPVPVFRPHSGMLWDLIAQDDIFWNFEKFLIDHNGVPQWRFAPSAWGAHGEFVEPFMQQMLENREKSIAQTGKANA